MKKTILSIILLITTINILYSQTNIYPTSGNVGIQTVSPKAHLHIDKINGAGIILSTNSAGTVSNPLSRKIQWGNYLGNDAGSIDLLDMSQNTHGTNMVFTIKNESNTLQEAFRINDLGNIGIGIKSPEAKLHVSGTIISGVKDYSYNAAVFQLTNQSNVDGISAVSPTGAFRWYTNPNRSFRDGFLYQLRSYDTTNGESSGLITITGSGNTGIGINSPEAKLHVSGTIISGVKDYSYNAAVFQLTNQSNVDGISAVSPTGAFRWYTNPNRSFRDGFLYQLRSYDTTNGESSGLITITGSGNTGIGTTSPGYKLDVCGTIRAKEVKVDLQGTCVPDFVFKKDYKLLSLDELEKFVTTKQHLPEIASEKEMIENGLNMKEFQMKLLQKMEEMTLYIIEQNKKNEKQEQELKLLKAEIKKIKSAKR